MIRPIEPMGQSVPVRCGTEGAGAGAGSRRRGQRGIAPPAGPLRDSGAGRWGGMQSRAEREGLLADPVLGQLAVQGFAADPERIRGFLAVAAMKIEQFEDVLFFDGFERECCTGRVG